MSGRPLRFLAGVIGVWTLGRVAFLLPAGPEMHPVASSRRPGPAPVAIVPEERGPPQAIWDKPVLPPVLEAHGASGQKPRLVPHADPITKPRRFAVDLTPAPLLASAEPPVSSHDTPPPSLLPTLPDPPHAPDRWSGSAWAILRQGSAVLLPGGQLGGSQAGIRLLRRLDSKGALAASVRLSTPLEGSGREMALGLDWRPSHRLPLRLLVEQRIALDRGQGGPAVLAVGGIGPRPIAMGLALTAYAQAGMVARTRGEPFADGAARVTHAIAPGLDLGLGLWGGAQRGAERVDIGPVVSVALPVPRQNWRLSLDWRQRVAGHAAPGSGPALPLASDF